MVVARQTQDTAVCKFILGSERELSLYSDSVLGADRCLGACRSALAAVWALAARAKNHYVAEEPTRRLKSLWLKSLLRPRCYVARTEKRVARLSLRAGA